MNLPTKLTNPSTSCFINDERNKPALFTSNDYDYDEVFKDEVCKRYNSYNKLVITLYIVSTLLVFTACTLITLLRFKLL